MSCRILSFGFFLVIIYFLKAGKVVKAVPANTENSDIVIPLLTKTSDDIDWTNDNFDTVIDHMLVKNSFSVHMFGHTVNSSKTGGTLRREYSYTDSGRDVHGSFQKIIIDWTDESWPHDSVYFQTSIKRNME
jgi:hypothetical protein